jgi:hypothetical protein
MSFIPCVTLANLTTPVTSIGGGGGGGSNVSFQNILASTLTVKPASGEYGVTLLANNNNTAGISFNDKTGLSTAYELYSGLNLASNTYDFILKADAPFATGNVLFQNINTLNTTNTNLNISTINGAIPATGTGSVNSVTGDTFSSIIATNTAGAVTLELGAYVASLPIGASPLFAFQTQKSSGTAGVIADLTSTFSETALAGGWYNITFNGILLFLAQTSTLSPIGSFAYPGSLIEHLVQVSYTVGGVTTNSDSYLQSSAVVPNPAVAFVVYPQSTFLNLTGSLYIPVGATINTIKLVTYFNTTEGSAGIVVQGGWQYGLPGTSPQDFVVLQKVKAA